MRRIAASERRIAFRFKPSLQRTVRPAIASSLRPLLLGAAALLITAPLFAADPAITVATGQTHRGWADAVVLRNRVVEAVIVPSIGRVMQFRFVGDTDGPFWENEKLLGQAMPANPWQANPGSFGGDKTWPAPQGAWNWPPPDVFDTAALKVTVNDDRSVTLESPVSPRFGIKTLRRITLDPAAPVMRIATTYEKVAGDPVNVGIWVISQLREPVGIFIPVPAGSKFPDNIRPPVPAAFLKRETEGGDWMRFTRNPARSAKIGMDGSSMVWADEKVLLRIDQPRVADAKYPDDGRSQQIYTNNNPAAYVELETVAPQQSLKVGDRATATNTYQLARRTSATIEQDVKALLAK